jgi:hypothetical protein
VAFERWVFGNGNIRYKTLFCLFSEDKIKNPTPGNDEPLSNFGRTTAKLVIEVLQERHNVLNVFFVVHGADLGPPFQFSKVNPETDEIDYTVVEGTQSSLENAWEKLNSEGKIDVFEASSEEKQKKGFMARQRAKSEREQK